jgi:hypothetical protein
MKMVLKQNSRDQEIAEIKSFIEPLLMLARKESTRSWDKFLKLPVTALGSNWKMSTGPELRVFFISFGE